MRIDTDLHAKLDAQIREHRATHGCDPPSLHLTHDEIDAWRDQFDAPPIPVASLAYRDIPIVAAHRWRVPVAGEALEESGICTECGRYASEADKPCAPP